MSTAVPAAPSLDRLTLPDAGGHFGRYGGVFVPETLMTALEELGAAYAVASKEPAFQAELRLQLRNFAGRPSPLYFAERLTQHCGGARIYLKREDTLHTGAHKINNALGQALLAVRMGKRRIVAETGAGQHGVATATACAHFGLPCEIYMGAEDVRRQSLNVFRMRLLGATVNEVTTGSRTLKDATNEAMRDWMASVGETHYVLGSVVGPHPFPTMVRDFQRVIGDECRAQCLDRLGGLPTLVVACVGGGSNAAGIFAGFELDASVRLLGVEAGGRGPTTGDHAATLCRGAPGVLHGCRTYVLQDDEGQTAPVHSCSAGLDYPGVGPEHAAWRDSGRVTYTSVTDDEALDAFGAMARLEGILPALETSHAIAAALREAARLPRDAHVVINGSGRGDKDVMEAMRLLDERAVR